MASRDRFRPLGFPRARCTVNSVYVPYSIYRAGERTNYHQHFRRGPSFHVVARFRGSQNKTRFERPSSRETETHLIFTDRFD